MIEEKAQVNDKQIQLGEQRFIKWKIEAICGASVRFIYRKQRCVFFAVLFSTRKTESQVEEDACIPLTSSPICYLSASPSRLD